MSPNPNSELLLPCLALIAAQLFTSSWHVLGKHILTQVPYLAPISFVLIRTLLSSTFLLIVGHVHEGRVTFPPLFRDDPPVPKELSLKEGLLKPSSSSPGDISSSASIKSGNSVGTLSKSPLASSVNGFFSGTTNNRGNPQPSLPRSQKHDHHRRRRRKKSRHPTFNVKKFVFIAIRDILAAVRFYQQQISTLNPDAVKIICAGLSGMLLLPVCYTTGLLLTSPTVASVWDGPMIPLGCFCAAVTLGLEKKSKFHPVAQVGSLLLAVVGSIVVVVVDYLGGGHGIKSEDVMKDFGSSSSWVHDHLQFIQGNIVFIGLVAAFSATALLQRRLNKYPPIHLTGWMFGIGFLGCFTLLLLESLFECILGSRILGCNLGQALLQISMALTTSPTFRYGVLYSALFVGGASFSIASYASSHLESSVITLFAAAQPPITAVLEWVWEGKGLGWKKVAGMGCVGTGMCLFTYIKSLDKEEKLEGNCQQKKKCQQKYAHSTKAQSYENGQVVRVLHSNGEGALNKGRSPNLTNRKAHCDV